MMDSMNVVEKTLRDQGWAKRHVRTGETAAAIARDVAESERKVRRAINAWRDWARKELLIKEQDNAN